MECILVAPLRDVICAWVEQIVDNAAPFFILVPAIWFVSWSSYYIIYIYIYNMGVISYESLPFLFIKYFFNQFSIFSIKKKLCVTYLLLLFCVNTN